jgi:cation diffusion facilitator CzcD-associated flavoprotein CzcO
MEWLEPGEQRAPRILILGGGFAGVYTGYRLQKELKDHKDQLAILKR